MSQHAIEQFFRRLSEDPALQREAEKTNALFSGFHFTQDEFESFSFDSLCESRETAE